jgi:hypothetical protein
MKDLLIYLIQSVEYVVVQFLLDIYTNMINNEFEEQIIIIYQVVQI